MESYLSEGTSTVVYKIQLIYGGKLPIYIYKGYTHYYVTCAILLELSRGMVSCMLLLILRALQYTMLIFGFSSLHALRQYEGDITWLIYVTIINLYYFSIFQYHNNNTSNISNINVHLTAIVSLRVPPLLSYNLSNLGVILLLFVFMLLPVASLSPASLT